MRSMRRGCFPKLNVNMPGSRSGRKGPVVRELVRESRGAQALGAASGAGALGAAGLGFMTART
jgi:hypothetical protein